MRTPQPRRRPILFAEAVGFPSPRAGRGPHDALASWGAPRGGEGLGVGGASRSNVFGPPPGSVLRTSPPSPPLVQVGCFRLGPIDKWPNPGTPGFGGGRVSALAVWGLISRT